MKSWCPARSKKIDSYHHGDLKHAILEASLKILSENCVHALSLRAAAKQAGVSSAAPYRHFPTKAALLASLAAYGFNSITTGLHQAVAENPTDSLAQMLAAGMSYLNFAQKNPELLRLMYSINIAECEELRIAHINTENTFFDLIQQGQKNNIITPGDPTNLGFVAFSFIHGLSLLLIDKHLCQEHTLPQGEGLTQWVRELFRIIWNGFAALPVSTPKSVRKKIPAGYNRAPRKTKKAAPNKQSVAQR